jgi:hypothetical protein
MAGNFRLLMIASCADTPKDAPAVDWLSLNISSCFWISNIEKTIAELRNKKEPH